MDGGTLILLLPVEEDRADKESGGSDYGDHTSS